MRAWIAWLVAATLGVAASAETVIESTPLQPAVATISVDEMSRGLRGYGLSVFAGSEPERFEVEVLGVLRNSTPELSYILARLSGQDLERSGVIAGMSGSPVYFGERLAGAVAFSYQFGLDAIAGITPIDAMRRLAELPVGTVARSTGAPRGLDIRFDDLVQREFASDLLSRQLERLLPASPQGARSALQWTASGFGGNAATLLRQSLGHLSQSGGGLGAAGDNPSIELVPGSAVAAVLVQGDLNLAAHGTVTDLIGDEVIAFGHPMFSLGPVNLPLAPSEVITVIANVANSFKVSNAGPVIGAFDQDREAGIRGRLGRHAPTTPITVRLGGLSERQYQMEVSNLPQMRPMLMAISTLGAIEAATYSGGYQGLDLVARIALREHEDLVARQSFDGDQAAVDSVIFLLSYLAYLEYNPLTEIELESVEVDLEQVDRPRAATLLAAHPTRTRVVPGQKVPITLELQPYRGERYRHVVEVEVPASAPNGRYVVLIGDGTSMDAVRLSVERRTPETFEQVLDVLRTFHSRRELVVFGLQPAQGLALGGETLPNLPGSVRAIFGAGVAPVGDALSLEIVHESLETLDRPIEGALRIDLVVQRRGE
ncbi:MAG: hypothetical protein AAF657_29255 [Acidobacteriota bacterium]